jgi:hypothetical protein
MRTNLTLLLSVMALAFALASWLPRRAAHTPPPAAVRLSPSPASDGADVGCVAANAKTLRGLMKNGINPTMTSLSFALYHAPDRDRLEKAATHSLSLIHCIRLAATLHIDVPLEGLPEYFRFLNNLQEDALAVNVSAMEGDDEGARHWFRHLKQDCVACHTRFRSDGNVPAPANTNNK